MPRPPVPRIRIGEGWDVHALVAGRPLVLGGVEVPHTHGLQGHSDADALCHAMTDALTRLFTEDQIAALKQEMVDQSPARRRLQVTVAAGPMRLRSAARGQAAGPARQ